MHRRPRLRFILFALGGFLILTAALLTGAFIATIPTLLAGAQTAREAAALTLSNPSEAAQRYELAEQQFSATLSSIQQLPEPLQLPSLVPPFSWYVHLNKAAVYLGRAGSNAASLAQNYPAILPSTDPSSLIASHSSAVNTLLTNQAETITELNRNLQLADAELSHVPSWIGFTHHRELTELKTQVHQVATKLPSTLTFVDALRDTLGRSDTNPHTALIIFQNDNELRPSGGFMGSYGVLTASSGTIRSFRFGEDIYRLDRGLAAKETIRPLPPLRTITGTWGFRDSNIGKGFLQDIGSQVATFYEKAAGTRPDVILFTDLTMLEDILKLTGPVTLPGTDVEITSANAGTELTQYIEKDYWNTLENQQTNAPKSILGELIPTLIGAMHNNAGTLRELPALLRAATQRKSLQLWTDNAQLATASQTLFPADAPATGDWLKVVNTNIGGMKSSRNMQQLVHIDEEVGGGWRTRTLTITRTHTGSGVWPDDANRNYLEIYLPAESEVLDRPAGVGGQNQQSLATQQAFGIVGTDPWPGEVEKLSQYVKVGFWATTQVGQTEKFTVIYRVPDSPAFKEAFMYLKQAGARNETLEAFGYAGSVTTNTGLEKSRGFW